MLNAIAYYFSSALPSSSSLPSAIAGRTMNILALGVQGNSDRFVLFWHPKKGEEEQQN